MRCDRKDSRPFAILCHFFNGNKEHWISSCCRHIPSRFLNGGQETAFIKTFFEKCLKESPPNIFLAENGFIWEPKNNFCETSPDSRYSRIAHILAFFPISFIFLNKSWPNMLRMRTRLRNATNGKTMQISSPLVKLCREHANKTGSFSSNKLNMAKHGKTW